MKRSQIELPQYFDRYVLKCDDVTIAQAFATSIEELKQVPLAQWKAIGDQVYEPGKWTIKDILQHILDTERVFMYRALAFSRGQATITGYDQDEYSATAMANGRSLESLLDEMMASRLSAIKLFESFTEEHLAKIGNGFKGPFSVASIGFILAGHQRWHFDIIKERYLPILA